MKVIFPTDLSDLSAAPVSVIHRSPDATDAHLTDYEIAVRTVPQGVPFRIVDLATFFPLDGTDNEAGEPNYDKTYREAWEADFSTPDGIGGQA